MAQNRERIKHLFFFGFCQAQCVWQCLTYQAIWIIWSSGHVISADRSDKKMLRSCHSSSNSGYTWKFYGNSMEIWKFYGNSKIWTQIRWKFCSENYGGSRASLASSSEKRYFSLRTPNKGHILASAEMKLPGLGSWKIMCEFLFLGFSIGIFI